MTMTDDWTFYFCSLDDKPASISVNLGLGPDVPIRSKPWRLLVRIHFRFPRQDGLSDSEEAPTLFLIEDALKHQVNGACGGVPCGRVTNNGKRDFCFYAERNDSFKSAVSSAMAGFGEYRFQLAEKFDPEWKYYLNVLNPSPEELQRAKNRDLLDVLVKQGDVLSAAREVQHWVYSPSEESRSLFRHEAGNAGFKIGDERESPVQGDCPFGLTVLRTQPVEQNLIDETVIELLRLAKRFGGEYDGWETPVISQ
jgi:uncharacterized protein (TIGR01619 family)